MRFSLPDKRTRNKGFTLVELMVIAPIALIIIAGFIALMMSIVGNVLVTHDENKMIFDSRAAINTIEADARISVQFMTATKGVLSPQGTSSNYTGSGNFTNGSNTLILQSLATTKNPNDSTRQLIYYANQPNSCGANETRNQIFAVTVVYFVKDNSLWRRTIVPPFNVTGTPDINTTCKAPWQLNSCSPGYTSTRCQTNDVELMKGVKSFNVAYRTSASSTTNLSTSSAASAGAVQVTIVGSKMTAGVEVEDTQVAVVSKLNDMPNNIGPTPLAITQQPANRSVTTGSSNVTFTARANFSNATVQWQQSTNGGSTWTNITGATNPTLNLNSVTTSMDGWRYRMNASVYGSTVTSNPATLSVVTIWEPLSLQNGWVQYNTSYASPAYAQSASGEVFLKGLIKSGSTVRGSVIATLPANLRPEKRLIFTVVKNSSTYGRVDVLPNGDVVIIDGNTGYTSLDSIHFMPSTANCPMIDMPLLSGWTNYSTTYSSMSSCKDTDGRIHVNGLIKPGTTTTNTVIANWPAGFAPDRSDILPAAHNEAYTPANVGSYVGGITSRYTALNYLNVMGSHYPASYNDWTSLPLSGDWANYSISSGGFTNARFTKSPDNVVVIEGLVRYGAETWDSVIGTLPVGYRPSERLMLNVATNGGHGRLDITTGGSVRFMTGTSGWLSLSDISFIAEQ